MLEEKTMYHIDEITLFWHSGVLITEIIFIWFTSYIEIYV